MTATDTTTSTTRTGSLAPVSRPAVASAEGGAGQALGDAFIMAGRNIRRLLRAPDQVVFALVSPIMFTLLFRYVFGGAIGGLNGIDYATYLIPGIAVQTAIFSAGTTGFALADDLSKGFVDRLRSLPMARSAVLAGRVICDTLNNAVGVIIIVSVGLLVGFRPSGVGGLLLGILLLLGFALSASFIFALVGMSVSSVEAVNAATFPVVFPLTFASTAFVPVATMPSWLQGFATYQPFSVVVSAFRSLVIGDISPQAREALFAGQGTTSLVLQSVGWTIALCVVFGSLAVRKYRGLTR